MSNLFNVALIQTTTGRDPDANIAAITPQISDAAANGADFVMLPETAGMMEPDPKQLHAKARFEHETAALSAFSEAAAKAGVWLLIGSLVVKSDEPGKLANRSFLVDGTGTIKARYDKIHLFDVELASGEAYRESSNYRHGDKLVSAETPWGILGMTICYDLRFAGQYRALANQGAAFLTVPSAFTRPTGQAHWHTLLRARAIENGCYVFAPAQCGEHEGGRQTYGHSLIVDPWGEVVADGGEVPGIITAEINPARVDVVRAQVPSLQHDRDYS
ncbi:MAG: carbon-nitrogen hydrolase family protein [Rhodospirillales bacterium]|jgi:deaminated glutathione amidase|nr:carbon-nitrogen hydrolase family protein [Rhodospirillales bacterium]MBT4040760.1 carbon-nitrogen hydrolase family protein [Rhodospirillales bacterium]MBT4625945.1 carbon-nitrogen hydrolase family protein [Rhodospirillales bacterium]MBT5350700.1 carbon-nitrogen hydrolase family protein [Rhodospirillales bacterium]MBT5522062.1 carbon-nitrogen hydrolase family protein [Rhodospirillales bacterium]